MGVVLCCVVYVYACVCVYVGLGVGVGVVWCSVGILFNFLSCQLEYDYQAHQMHKCTP